MKGIFLSAALVAASGFVFVGSAGDGAQVPAAGNAAFDRIKGLEGTWTGTAGQVGSEAGEVTVRYRVTAGGNAVEETLFAGTAHEMVTMYYLDDDGVSLVHFCASGNHPKMRLSSGADPATMTFRFAEAVNFDVAETHMHDGVLYLLGGDRLRTEWLSWVDGKPGATVRFDLTRAK